MISLSTIMKLYENADMALYFSTGPLHDGGDLDIRYLPVYDDSNKRIGSLSDGNVENFFGEKVQIVIPMFKKSFMKSWGIWQQQGCNKAFFTELLIQRKSKSSHQAMTINADTATLAKNGDTRSSIILGLAAYHLHNGLELEDLFEEQWEIENVLECIDAMYECPNVNASSNFVDISVHSYNRIIDRFVALKVMTSEKWLERPVCEKLGLFPCLSIPNADGQFMYYYFGDPESVQSNKLKLYGLNFELYGLDAYRYGYRGGRKDTFGNRHDDCAEWFYNFLKYNESISSEDYGLYDFSLYCFGVNAFHIDYTMTFGTKTLKKYHKLVKSQHVLDRIEEYRLKHCVVKG